MKKKQDNLLTTSRTIAKMEHLERASERGIFDTIDEVANELTTRLNGIFLRNADGERPVFGSNRRLQDDPHFRDHVLFHEYFHGDTGRGVGASHQTGWTGLVAKLLHPRRKEASSPREVELAAEIGALSFDR